jgi:hypothetical protein
MVIMVEVVVYPPGQVVEEEREQSATMVSMFLDNKLVQVVRDCLRGLRGVLLRG